nr:MAG TPA_asm: hypothetical protein [Caudoviricetes sp.]
MTGLGIVSYLCNLFVYRLCSEKVIVCRLLLRLQGRRRLSVMLIITVTTTVITRRVVSRWRVAPLVSDKVTR